MTARQQLIALARRQVWASLLGSFSFALVVSVTEYIRTGGVSGLTSVVAVLVGGVVGLVVGRIVMGKPEQPEQPERVSSPRSPSDLAALVKGKTAIAARAITAPYIGTWLKVRSPVANVIESDDGEGREVWLEGSEVEPAIVSSFEGCWSKRVEILAIGDMVTVKGEIASITPIFIELKECELV